MDYNIDQIKNMKKEHEYFIGIDSDGCAFDTMEIKHKECFAPNTIKYWNLQRVSKYGREAAEFVNLYSKWRGINRFPALVNVLDLLEDRAECKERGYKIPDITPLRKWIKEEDRLGNPALIEKIKQSDEPVFKQALEWSLKVNETVADMVHGVPPFPYVEDSLKEAIKKCDMIVVSATPCAALNSEWSEHGIDKYVNVIGGQEMGSKKEMLAATKSRYPKNKCLMIGDAPGDQKAAKANGMLFYPINPGAERDSWKRFLEQAYDKFINLEYEGEYEASLIAEFDTYLPEKPPWK